MLQISHNLEKCQWRHNLPTWRYHQLFWVCFVSLSKFSYRSKFYVNIITGLELWQFSSKRDYRRKLSFSSIRDPTKQIMVNEHFWNNHVISLIIPGQKILPLLPWKILVGVLEFAQYLSFCCFCCWGYTHISWQLLQPLENYWCVWPPCRDRSSWSPVLTVSTVFLLAFDFGMFWTYDK